MQGNHSAYVHFCARESRGIKGTRLEVDSAIPNASRIEHVKQRLLPRRILKQHHEVELLLATMLYSSSSGGGGSTIRGGGSSSDARRRRGRRRRRSSSNSNRSNRLTRLRTSLVEAYSVSRHRVLSPPQRRRLFHHSCLCPLLLLPWPRPRLQPPLVMTSPPRPPIAPTTTTTTAAAAATTTTTRQLHW